MRGGEEGAKHELEKGRRRNMSWRRGGTASTRWSRGEDDHMRCVWGGRGKVVSQREEDDTMR